MKKRSVKDMIPEIGTRSHLNPSRLELGPEQKFVVTGCARSGTRFMKLLLNSPDIKKQVGHERLYQGGIVSWMIAHKNQSAAIVKAFQDYPTKWIHIVRDPIKVIQSISRLAVDPSGRIGYQPFFDQFPNYAKYSNFFYIWGVINWIQWNRRIQEIFPIDLTIRVEDINDGSRIAELADLLEVEENLLKQNVKRLGSNAHAHPVSWAQEMDTKLLFPFSMKWLKGIDFGLYLELIHVAKTFGYDLEAK